jgi:hypothetical protein
VGDPRAGSTEVVRIMEPRGKGSTPLTGGACDDRRRPTIVLVHGFGLSDPAAYEALIDHFVSVGNIVVFPTYTVVDHDADGDVDRTDLQESFRTVDAAATIAVDDTPRIDKTKLGWWGHSHGGGMIPWLVQQAASRGWGRRALWMSNVAQAYTQLVGDGAIRVPRHTEALTIAFGDDVSADNRLGIDVFESLTLPPSQKRHVTLQTDRHSEPALVADHATPIAVADGGNALDFALWRYADILERCAISGTRCDADLAEIGRWPDGTPITPPLVSRHPTDSGPAPAQLAECDSGYASGGSPAFDLNPRRSRCGPSRIT